AGGEAAGGGGTGAEAGGDATAAATAEVGSDAVSGGRTDTGEVIAVVNGEAISLGEFQRQAFDTQRYFVDQGGIDPNTEDGQKQLLFLRRQVLSDMINQTLIEQAATELGITASDEEIQASLQKYIDELGGEDKFEQSLADTGSTREQVTEMERASIIGTKMLDQIAGDVPTTAEFVHARHILCKSADVCQDALLRLEGGEDFTAVAKEVSEDPTTRDRGGDLDWVTRGMLPSQQLEDALFALEPGTRSNVVQTDFGFHVIELIERDPERALDEAQRTRLKEKKLIAWQDERRKAAKIEIMVEDLKDAADPVPAGTTPSGT
ncbi:MAG: hypothetical protein DYG90_10425, partial [Chloroflexi bacterium CFX6]|nr:hypothetical protein [Chloroflexi bacterium CFX6]